MKRFAVALLTLLLTHSIYAQTTQQNPKFQGYFGALFSVMSFQTRILGNTPDEGIGRINMMSMFGVGGGVDLGFIHHVTQHFSYGFEAFYLRQSENAHSTLTTNGSNTYSRLAIWNAYGASFLPYYFFTSRTALFWRLGVIADQTRADSLNSDPANDPFALGGLNTTILGPQIGMGFSQMLGKYFNLRLEYDFAFLPTRVKTVIADEISGETEQITLGRIYDNRVIFALNYLFG